MITPCITGGTKKRSGRRRRQPVRPIILLLICALAAAGRAAGSTGHALHIPSLASSQGMEDAGSGPSSSMADSDSGSIPGFSGADVVELNGNMPCFTKYDLENISGETYSSLDSLGRCGTATAMLDRTMMPKGERGSIGMVKPSGWRQAKYPGIIEDTPPYLYNRCHLVAYAMTGQGANLKNLTTGTRHMNTTMLPYEKQVLRYLDRSDNHVLYRVSPHFKGAELVARGVEMEAYSVEDHGEGVCFHVYIYNIQPGIGIDYATGKSWAEGKTP